MFTVLFETNQGTFEFPHVRAIARQWATVEAQMRLPEGVRVLATLVIPE